MEVKPPTTYEEQLEHLKARGCVVGSDAQAIEVLGNVNYYWLIAYFLPFKTSDGKYQNGVSFEKVVKLYNFDQKLRQILFSAIEEIEIFLRAKIAYFHAHKYGALGYLNSENFGPRHNHKKFLEIFEREISNNEKNLFVKHHIEKYDRKFPIWVAIEIFSFGMLSKFFMDLTTQDQKKLSRELYKSIPRTVNSCLCSCTVLRNLCAHYGRLYFKIFPISPRIQGISEYDKQQFWGAILAVREIYPFPKIWNDRICASLKALFEEFSDSIDLARLAFPRDWLAKLRK